jgi:hypothetical protein
LRSRAGTAEDPLLKERDFGFTVRCLTTKRTVHEPVTPRPTAAPKIAAGGSIAYRGY